jgi:cytochrome c oxidase assembly factor CtaG
MTTWDNITWLPICAGLTAVGLVLSYFAWRRRGARSGIRGTAWSLLPMALYLTGSILLVGRIGSAIVRFASAFVFSPKTWSGVVLLVLAAVMLLFTGGVPLLSSRRRRARKAEAKQQEATAGNGRGAVSTQSGRAAGAIDPATTRPAKAVAKRGKQGAGDDTGLDDDVAEILRRRGIS